MTNELKSDIEDDLPIRQNLVDTAGSFLLNPNVKQRPDDAKIAFLKKKGLTDSEISEAFSRIKSDIGTDVVSNDDRQLVNAFPLPPYQTPYSFWVHLRNYSSGFINVAVAIYILHRFYKSYIEPWLFGSKSEKSELSALKQELIELNNSVSRLTSTVASLEETVYNQMHQMDKSTLYDVESVPKSVRDILDEVSNVKGLLLNRFSFPAPPAIAGVPTENITQNQDVKIPPKVVTIPKWQLCDSDLEKSKVDPIEQIKETEDKEISSSKSTSFNDSLNSVENQENNANISKYKVQKEDSSTALEVKIKNQKACLDNNLHIKGNEDSKMSVQNQVKDIEEKTLDEDSGVESHNYLSDSESTGQTSGPNESCESKKNSE